MFKKKTWKRGDKLNAKELNRIEQGGFYLITADEDITNINTTGPVFTNWSISPKDFRALTKANQKICLSCNISLTRNNYTEHIQTAWFYSTFCDLGNYNLIGFVSELGLLEVQLSCGKDEDSEIEIKYNVLVPDTNQ